MRASRASLPSLLLALVVVAAASACRVDLPASSPTPASLAGMDPVRGRVGIDLPVTITGAGFAPRVSQDLGAPDGVRVDDAFEVLLGDHALADVRFEDAETLRAKVPADLPAGSYRLVVVTPFDERLTLDDAYEAYEEDRTPAALSGAFETPPAATTSQTLSVALVVTNGGEASALGVLPDEPAVTATGAASASLVEEPAAQDIAGGASATFTWSYQVGDGTGTLSFATEARGSDELSGAEVSTGEVRSGELDVQGPPILSGTLSLPDVLSTGQAFEVTLLVENTGEATAASVLPGALTPSATGGATATLVSAPSALDVPPGAPVAFTWSYTVAGPLTAESATLSFSGEAEGVDANSGAPAGTGTFASEEATVVEGAVLVTRVSAPAFVSVGGQLNVTVEVENTGAAAALDVAPEAPPVPSGAGLVHSVSGPLPASADTLAGGATATFSYTYAADAEGTFTFAARAAGSDENSLATVTSPEGVSSIVEVQPPADLSAVLTAPSVLSVGQPFTVTMALTNNGGVDLTGVEPSALSQDPAGAATLVSAPEAPFPTLAANGGTAQLTWSYLAATAGTFTFEGTASGTDANGGGAVTSPVAESNAILVEEPPSFVLVWNTPPSVTRGQIFDVTLIVTNEGQAGALGVAPGTLDVAGASGTTCGAPSPASADVAGGTSAPFTWTCTAGGASGPVTLSVSVSGTDENASTTVTSAVGSSDAVAVQSAPQLTVSWTLPPGDVSYAQPFSLSLDVTNAGEASATVAASAVTVLGTTGTSCEGALPQQQAVSGGDTASFTVACTAGATSGNATFEASASGTDDNSGDAASAAPFTSAPLVVESPPALTAEWGTLPARVSFAGAFAAELTVFNDGEAGASDVAPAGFGVTGSGTTCTGPTPASAAIAPSSQQVFTYACTAAAPSEEALLSAAASGNDENAGTGVTATSVDSEVVLIGSVAALDVTLVSAADATVYQRQQGVRVELSVANLGEAAADVVSAADWLAFSAAGVDVSDEYTAVPSAANPTTIAGGATEVFAFDVNVGPTATLGAVLLDGAADGSDALDGTLTSDAGATTTDTWTVAVNEPPVACFVTDVNAREVNQAFALDASCSTDLEDAAGLTVEWDFENDGTFDTAPTTTRTASHSYAAEGVFTIALRVTDRVGFTSYASHTVAVAAAGRLRLVTNTDASGTGSFIGALALANENLGADTITFDPAVFSGATTIFLNNGQNPIFTDDDTRVFGHEGVRINSTRGLSLDGDGLVIAYLRVTGSSNGPCMDIDGSNIRVLGTEVNNCDSVGVRIDGNANVVGPDNVFPGNYDDDVAIQLGGSGNVVEGSRFLACDDTCIDFLFGAANASVRGNVVDGILGDGVVLFGSGHDVHHNTFHAVTGTAVDAEAGTNHSVRNNIFSNVFTGALCGDGADVDADFNDLFNVVPNACDAPQGPNSLSVDPQYIDAAGGDLRLLSTSPLIDAGDPGLGIDVNGAAPGLYDGAAPDIGAYEYNPG